MPKELLNPKLLPDKYLELKDQIVNGTISIESTRELYDECNKFSNNAEKAQSINKIMQYLDKIIEPEMLHNFVAKLVEVEKQVLREHHPILETHSPEKVQAVQHSRCADYMRNTSLAKNAMRFEITKNGLAKEVYQSIKSNNVEKAQAQMADFQVPDYLQDHYSNIRTFYKENGNELGVVKNLSFHAISTAVTMYANEEFAAKKISGEVLSKTGKEMASINKALYSANDDTAKNKLLEQIPEIPGSVTIQFKPKQQTFGQKIAQRIEKIVAVVKKVFFAKQKPLNIVKNNSLPKPTAPAIQSVKKHDVPKTVTLADVHKQQAKSVGATVTNTVLPKKNASTSLPTAPKKDQSSGRG